MSKEEKQNLKAGVIVFTLALIVMFALGLFAEKAVTVDSEPAHMPREWSK